MKTNGIGIRGFTFARNIISFISLLLAKASIIPNKKRRIPSIPKIAFRIYFLLYIIPYIYIVKYMSFFSHG
jgi:hypothetical protein